MASRPRGNPTEFAILGLLAEKPRSGYDIKKEVEERLGHFWSESYGHIYPMLRRLNGRKLVAVRPGRRQPGRPDRRVYSLTASGRRALEAWFTHPPGPSRPRNELLLRIFLGRFAPPATLLRDVQTYRAGVLATLRQLRGIRAAVRGDAAPSPDLVYWALALDFGVRVFQALDDWSGLAERRLKELRRSRGQS
jgi:PadR family transcriptional regulator, regulatory protein AphA